MNFEEFKKQREQIRLEIEAKEQELLAMSQAQKDFIQQEIVELETKKEQMHAQLNDMEVSLSQKGEEITNQKAKNVELVKKTADIEEAYTIAKQKADELYAQLQSLHEEKAQLNESFRTLATQYTEESTKYTNHKNEMANVLEMLKERKLELEKL